MRVRELITQTTQILSAKDIDEPTIEAISLIAHGLGIDKTSLYTRYNNDIADAQIHPILELINRRAKYEPLEYLIGKVNFMGFDFLIKPPVFIPRPETETLVETLIELAKLPLGVANKGYPLVFDIGTGCGAIGIAVLKFLPTARVYASDIVNIRLAKLNAIKNGVNDRIMFIRGNMFNPFKPIKLADFIISNPPYIPTSRIPSLQPEVKLFESHSSIDGREDGLFFIRKLIREAGKYLGPDGALLLELSPEQENEVREEAMQYFKSVNFFKDFNGFTRGLIAKYAKSFS